MRSGLKKRWLVDCSGLQYWQFVRSYLSSMAMACPRRMISKCLAQLHPALAVIVLLCTSLEHSWQAAAAERRPSTCKFSPYLTRTATAVTGPRSLRLDDGTEVVLQGILPPSKLDHRSVAESWSLPAKTAKALVQATVGRTIELSGNARNRDRYGRRIAHVHVRTNAHKLWLQAFLAQTGLARVADGEIKDKCKSAILLRAENAARDKQVGLWSDAGYAIKDASKPWQILRYRSTFQIVEGRVRAVARVRSRVYVNFGRQWKRDFTIGVRSRLAKKLRISGLRLEQLKGRRIRIRGWIDRRGGPFIELTSASQISLVPSRKLAGRPAESAGPLPNPSPVPTHQDKQKRPGFRKPDAFDL